MSTKHPYESRTPHHRIFDVDFRLQTSREILSASCKEIFQPVYFDELLHPIPGGLYDLAMGSIDRFANCATCGQSDKFCPGHFAHINLPLPVYNPVFFSFTLELLKGSCLNCHRMYVKKESLPVELLLAQLRALNLGFICEIEELRNSVVEAVSNKGELENLRTIDDDIVGSKVEGPKRKAQDDLKNDVIFQSMFSSDSANQAAVQDTIARLKTLYTDGETPRVRCRNVVQKRRELIRDFCQKFLYKRPRHCTHCGTPTVPIRHQYHQSILVGTKKQTWKTSLMTKKAKKEEKLTNLDDFLTSGDASIMKKKQTVGENVDILEQMKMMKKELQDLEEAAESLPDEHQADQKVPIVGSDGSRYFSPLEVKQHFREVWNHFGDVLCKIFPVFANFEQSEQLHKVDFAKDPNAFLPSDVLFFDVLPVLPTKFRPCARVAGAISVQNAHNVAYKKILEQSQLLRFFVKVAQKAGNPGSDPEKSIGLSESEEAAYKSTPGKTCDEKVHNVYLQLQQRVNNLYDSDLDRLNKEKVPGIRQVLEKKEGLFRKHMMGKRVNFACRTVITPDPYQDMDEVGIPDIFSKKLTFPTPVNQFNVQKMRDAVKNGPDEINGANFMMTEDGVIIRLDPVDFQERDGIAKRLYYKDLKSLKRSKKVFRHLAEGDVMLLNRQPTLHKPSIQAHKVRILTRQKVIRLHYGVCKPYNADFDGDEMNAHFPQNDVARSEGYEIAAVPYQYLVPKDGSPVLGLIQDHIVSGVLLTVKDQFFTKEDYQFLVLNAFGYLKKKLKFLCPAILRPCERWTGKQVVSTVILNVIPDGYPLLNLNGKAKTSVKSWQIAGRPQPCFSMSESETVFRQGELLCGVLDKADYGPTAFGLVHCCYELYHPKVAAQLLSCFSRLFTTFLQYHGFSLGIADVLVSDSADSKRRKIIDDLRQCGFSCVKNVLHFESDEISTNHSKALDSTNQNKARHSGSGLDQSDFHRISKVIKSKLEEIYSNEDKSHIKELDYAMKTSTDKFNDKVNKACLPHGLLKVFPENSLQCMIESGAKGNMVNQVQMSCMLGQIELEGCRPPLTPSGRTLPSFLPYDWSPRAGGFVDGRFATGIRPQEFFFHTMAGREGLIDTAVKTSRSGYLQRCIIKHLESVMVNYDLTVRDSDQSVIQFQYGEDGLDIGRVQFLNDNRLKILANNLSILENTTKNFKYFHDLDAKKAEKMHKKIKRWQRKNGQSKKVYNHLFTLISSKFTENNQSKQYLVDEYRKMDEETRKRMSATRCPDPVSSRLNPFKYFGALPEKLIDSLDHFISDYDEQSTNNRSLLGTWSADQSETFRRAVYWKGMRAFNEPGEPVGIVAAQSIGEPSTQMTLNTFHFAGRGEMNVTLGIPRLREILMTASAKIATPTAQVPFLADVAKHVAESTKRVMDRLHLKQFIKSMKISEKLQIDLGQVFMQYTVELKFLKRKQRPEETHHLSNATVVARLERKFFKNLSTILRKKIENSRIELKHSVKKGMRSMDAFVSGAPGARQNESDGEPEQLEEDIDAADARRFERENDETEYIGEADERQEVMPSEDEDSDVESDDDNLQTTGGDGETKPEIFDTENLPKRNDARILAVISSASNVVAYDYDAKKHSWCKGTIQVPLDTGTVDVASLVVEEIEKFVVQETLNIQRCLLKEDNDKLLLLTEGINLQSFYERAHLLDVNKISCNDIHTIARTYGIEAAAQALIKEIKMVFGAYGIHVDHRHLSLVSDYMTHTGSYMPFNRTYMSTSASPFQKMSFETTTNFLKDAIYTGEKEELKSVSSQLVVGALPKIGTGCFDLMVDVKKC